MRRHRTKSHFLHSLSVMGSREVSQSAFAKAFPSLSVMKDEKKTGLLMGEPHVPIECDRCGVVGLMGGRACGVCHRFVSFFFSFFFFFLLCSLLKEVSLLNPSPQYSNFFFLDFIVLSVGALLPSETLVFLELVTASPMFVFTFRFLFFFSPSHILPSLSLG